MTLFTLFLSFTCLFIFFHRTTLRFGPRIAGYCSAIGLTASTFTWYRFSASRFHGLTIALFVVPNMGILHYGTKFVHKHDVTLPITYGELKGDKAILTSAYVQGAYGSAIPLITASYPFIGSTWTKGRKAGLSFKKHVAVQMKNFFFGFSLRSSKRHYRVLLVNVILQLGIGSLLGYNQVLERELVEKRAFKEGKILPECEDLFLDAADLSSMRNTYDSFVERINDIKIVLFPPSK